MIGYLVVLVLIWIGLAVYAGLNGGDAEIYVGVGLLATLWPLWLALAVVVSPFVGVYYLAKHYRNKYPWGWKHR